MLVNPDKLRQFAKKLNNEKSNVEKSLSDTNHQMSKLVISLASSDVVLKDDYFLQLHSYAKGSLNQLQSSLSNLQTMLEREAHAFETADLYNFNLPWQSALTNIGIAAAFQKSGLLYITSSRKGNHYLFKYNRKVERFLKGRIGPKWAKLKIQSFNRLMKRINQRAKVIKNSGVGGVKKAGAKVVRAQAVTLPGQVKKKIFKGTGTDLVISKGKFITKFAKGNMFLTLGATTLSEVDTYKQQVAANKKRYTGERLEVANARAMGESGNRVFMKTAGAFAGGAAGAAIGSLAGPFGTVVGGFVGAAIGEAVGGWAAKYTSGFAANVAEKTRETFNNVKKSIGSGFKKVFSWGN
ncbi:hypothetical protein DCC39_17300 [Pueribacillus theae]|uniref:LXG domain-containing protein n=1 Tax=Pueribacillus theae TaxID=2171751 RepID=A0A2U1JNZ9_9BACI|nr:hypothetical protein [Pueribacillus theae]PWA06689.1 hypothetical protein DCC39_17300 [Pueribacillus theae]